MGRLRTIWLAMGLLAMVAPSARAAVDLTLYNSNPLLDNDNYTMLYGDVSTGYLVQLILVGPNGVVDPPDIYGAPGADDTLFLTTHVGVGFVTPTDGYLVRSSILYPDDWGGASNAYVRFWNATTPAGASNYGTSAMFTLPSGDFFGLAEFDFTPYGSLSANTPFSAATAVPEPSHLFLLGLLIIGGYLYRRSMKKPKTVIVAFSLLLFAGHSDAQLSSPFDVTASVTIRDANAAALPGSNPAAPSPIPGCLVQVIYVGANGVADLPNLDGTPGGDDTNVYTTVIGQGISWDLENSGRFSTSFYPPQASGTKLYARVFNAPTVAGATHWGQSATFTVQGADVFDLSALGLQRTAMPKGVDLNTVDSKGLTFYQELIANTNPNDPGDYFSVKQVGPSGGFGPASQLSVVGRAGRQYILERVLDLGAGNWSGIVTSAVLNADTNLTLDDPNPPNTPKAFYRLKAIMP